MIKFMTFLYFPLELKLSYSIELELLNIVKVLTPVRRPLRRLSVLTSPTVATSMATSANGSPRQIADEQTLFTRLSSSFASSRRTSSQISTRPSSSELSEVQETYESKLQPFWGLRT